MADYSAADSDVVGTTAIDRSEWRGLEKPERKRAVLDFLAMTRLALPPQAIFRNLRLHYNVEAGYKTIRRYLGELVEENLARRIEGQPVEQRRLVDADNGRAWYVVSGEGLSVYHQTEGILGEI